jgi:hypothetical protein
MAGMMQLERSGTFNKQRQILRIWLEDKNKPKPQALALCK